MNRAESIHLGNTQCNMIMQTEGNLALQTTRVISDCSERSQDRPLQSVSQSPHLLDRTADLHLVLHPSLMISNTHSPCQHP